MATVHYSVILLTYMLIDLVDVATGFPSQRIANISREDVKHTDMLPPDHIAGGHMEHDGDLNKDYHHEAFLGRLIKEGKLVFDKMDVYRKLIYIFHKVDRNGDHLLEKEELQFWIHDRILDHFRKAAADSYNLFKKVDVDKDDQIKWYEYKATLVDMEPRRLKDANVSCRLTYISVASIHPFFAMYVIYCTINTPTMQG